MSYTVKVRRPFKAFQGLRSPIRDEKGLPGQQPKEGYDLVLQAEVAFADHQVGEKGWFVDSDAVDSELEKVAQYLSTQPWNELFEFRPTFERVAHWAYSELEPHIPALKAVKLTNRTLGISVTYAK